MQFPADTHTIIFFGLFFLPGFICIKVYSFFMATERFDFSKSWQEVVAYSTIFSGITYLLYSFPKLECIVWLDNIIPIVGLFIIPAISPHLIIKLQQTQWFHDNMILPQPTAWDYIFGKREAYWVIVHLKSGIKIGGKYDCSSYTSSYPYTHDIYIEELWGVDDDGKFLHPIEQSKGMWIAGEEILGVEFFSLFKNENGDEKK